MSPRSKSAIVAAVLAAAMAGLLAPGCGRSPEAANDTAQAATHAVPAAAAAESSPPPPAASAPAPASPSESSRESASASSAAVPSPAGMIPGTIDEPAPSSPRFAGSTAVPYPRPEEVPLAPMGHKIGPSPLTQSPGYFPPNDPEAESVLTGRRKVALVGVPFTGGESSPERLALAILDALRTGDAHALHSLRVSEDEFTKIMWPEFPQSRPICNSNAHDTFFFLDRKCHQGVGVGVDTWGTQDLRLEGIEYGVGRAPYLNFTLYHGVQIHARTTEGEERVVRFVQAFAERKGIWKVYNYQDKE